MENKRMKILRKTKNFSLEWNSAKTFFILTLTTILLHLWIFIFNKYLLRAYYLSSTILGSGATTMEHMSKENFKTLTNTTVYEKQVTF